MHVFSVLRTYVWFLLSCFGVGARPIGIVKWLADVVCLCHSSIFFRVFFSFSVFSLHVFDACVSSVPVLVFCFLCSKCHPRGGDILLSTSWKTRTHLVPGLFVSQEEQNGNMRCCDGLRQCYSINIWIRPISSRLSRFVETLLLYQEWKEGRVLCLMGYLYDGMFCNAVIPTCCSRIILYKVLTKGWDEFKRGAPAIQPCSRV